MTAVPQGFPVKLTQVQPKPHLASRGDLEGSPRFLKGASRAE